METGLSDTGGVQIGSQTTLSLSDPTRGPPLRERSPPMTRTDPSAGRRPVPATSPDRRSRSRDWGGLGRRAAVARVRPASVHRTLLALLAGAAAALAPALAVAAGVPPGPGSTAGPKAALKKPAAGRLKLHVPSPDWRDQVIYFVMTDRFADGNPRNNDQGAGEYDPRRRDRFSGGDLQGLIDRLDYIQGLGATALWITPPVLNQWLDATRGYGGYHGYWAADFTRVDPHLGTLQDYRLLSDALHRRGMYLVQDIVVNHTGNFFDYVGGWDPADPARFWQANPGSRPQARPSQYPFDLNDPRDPRQRRAGIYHWTPAVADYTDRRQELDFQMSGLDDLNTGNPVVRRALRASYAHWIREVGVDAFRIDTAFYVPPEYFLDFLHARDPRAPGIAEVARRTGRSDFLVFGEGFGIDRPFEDLQARKIESYMTGPDGRPVLPGMLNFPLYGALAEVFARGRPPAELGHRIAALARLHARPHLMPGFLDNHDLDRFLAGGSEAALRQALLALFTLPGIPVIYYGTEQGLRDPRGSMFAAGWGSGGRDRFDTTAPLYRHIARLAALRRAEPLFSRGLPTMRAASEARSGVLAWSMQHEGQQALVLMNTADAPVLAARVDTGLPAGARLAPLLALGVEAHERTVDADGSVTLLLPARAAVVWKAVPGAAPAAGATAAGPAPMLELDPIGEQALTGDAVLRGRLVGLGEARLVFDGDVAAATLVRAGRDGRFEARLDTGALVDPRVRHGVVLWGGDAAPQAVSALRTFRVERAWQLLADVDDPAGDDHGPDGRYVYPTDPSWGDRRQMDLRWVRVFGAAGALRIDIEPSTITTSWNPPAGFDHVHYTVFIELPGRPGGATVMPLQGGVLPDGMRWHRRLRAGGWSAALFSDAGADERQEGTPVTPGPQVTADRGRGVVTMVLPAAAFGPGGAGPGTRVWVTTWDYDGGYRALQAQPAPFAIGGAASGPKVMDSSRVIVLP